MTKPDCVCCWDNGRDSDVACCIVLAQAAVHGIDAVVARLCDAHRAGFKVAENDRKRRAGA